MTGENYTADHVTKRDYWVDVYETAAGGVDVGFLLEDKSLDEVFDFMRDYYKQGNNDAHYYEVRIKVADPASSKR